MGLCGTTQMNTTARESFGTSCSLLERVKANVPEAWRQLTILYGPLVYHWCRRNGLKSDDAADVVQDVFRTLVVHIQAFRRDREGHTFRGWLWTVTRSRINDHFQRAKGQPTAVGGSGAAEFLAELSEKPTIPENEPEAPEGASAMLHRALEMIRGDFEEPTWQAFRLTALGSYTSAEAGRELNLSSNAVRKAKARVLQRLREELGEVIDA
jgi:RNA polymerase sigma-70 factor (ECF subfamily)